MAKTKSIQPFDNPITKGIEGTSIWSPKTLTVGYAQAEDKIEAKWNGLFQIRGSFNPLEESDAVDKLFRADIDDAQMAYSRVTGIEFSPAANFGDADFKFAGMSKLKSFTGTDLDGISDYIGWNAKGMGFSDWESYLFVETSDEHMLLGKDGMTEDGGGNYRYRVILHEMGHMLGLSHPYEKANGTTPWTAQYETLDNERYTIMSYEEGGLDQRTPRSYGHTVTPMAIDIAALQHMYGKTELHSGNTTYRLTDPGSAKLDVDGDDDGTVSIGRAFYCIWDTGGADTIAYDGSSRVLINLNDATLSRSTDDAGTQDWIKTLTGTVGGKAVYDSLPPELQNDLTKPEYHAGGFFSRVFSDSGAQLGGYSIAKGAQLGGYSIAKGAQIENAVGGPGNDVLIGNEGNNELIGNSGKDLLLGAVGADTLVGRDGYDLLFGGDGNDLLIGGLGRDDQSGGADNDVYVYTSVEDSPADNINSDRIAFVGAGAAIGDRIDFAAIDADFGIAGNQSFSFLGTNAPYDGEAAAKIWVVGGSQDADTTVYASVDSDNTPELLIFAVDGVATAADWTSGDFLL